MRESRTPRRAIGPACYARRGIRPTSRVVSYASALPSMTECRGVSSEHYPQARGVRCMLGGE